LKCAIIYYSQTGNTEKIAKKIQEGIKEAAGHCDLIKIKEANPKRLYQYDLIGFGSPVYAGPPLNVKAFMQKLQYLGGKHAFAFCTHGTRGEKYFYGIYPKIKKAGMTLLAMRDWYGDCFLPWHPEPYATAGHPDEIDMREAKDFGKEVVELSRKVSAGEKVALPGKPVKPPPDTPAELEVRKTIKDTLDDKSIFKYHPEKCLYPKCRICMDNCPMDGIDLSVNPPVRNTPCQPHCSLCTLVCPTGALEMDDWVKEQAPLYKNTTKIYALPYLDVAEKEGKFRRLVPKDKIGWNTYVYQVHNKHPKFIPGKGPV
jgi:flavodoxin/Fe-S-cluster-containing hydrogenase component 2